MTQFTRSGLRSVTLALAIAGMFTTITALPLAAQAEAAQYRVLTKLTKSGYRSVRVYGPSRYVCTPSGFGQKGRCFLRSSV
ncbi:hypothetical protein [Devosia sp.]|uniref:hypothetical protein n=1 Tax=Devosia sp. TaxID=1871048 RepID=UPI003A8FDA64